MIKLFSKTKTELQLSDIVPVREHQSMLANLNQTDHWAEGKITASKGLDKPQAEYSIQTSYEELSNHVSVEVDVLKSNLTSQRDYIQNDVNNFDLEKEALKCLDTDNLNVENDKLEDQKLRQEAEIHLIETKIRNEDDTITKNVMENLGGVEPTKNFLNTPVAQWGTIGLIILGIELPINVEAVTNLNLYYQIFIYPLALSLTCGVAYASHYSGLTLREGKLKQFTLAFLILVGLLVIISVLRQKPDENGVINNNGIMTFLNVVVSLIPLFISYRFHYLHQFFASKKEWLKLVNERSSHIVEIENLKAMKVSLFEKYTKTSKEVATKKLEELKLEVHKYSVLIAEIDTYKATFNNLIKASLENSLSKFNQGYSFGNRNKGNNGYSGAFTMIILCFLISSCKPVETKRVGVLIDSTDSIAMYDAAPKICTKIFEVTGFDNGVPENNIGIEFSSISDFNIEAVTSLHWKNINPLLRKPVSYRKAAKEFKVTISKSVDSLLQKSRNKSNSYIQQSLINMIQNYPNLSDIIICSDMLENQRKGLSFYSWIDNPEMMPIDSIVNVLNNKSIKLHGTNIHIYMKPKDKNLDDLTVKAKQVWQKYLEQNGANVFFHGF